MPPSASGALYDPAFEHDSCGVAFVADLSGPPSHQVVELGIRALENLAHRGAFGADPGTGDGAGLLVQLPDRLFRQVVDFELPPAGQYGTGMAFLPRDPAAAPERRRALAATAAAEGLGVLGWREVPVDLSQAGATAAAAAPAIEQVFLAADGPPLGGLELERRLFLVRKQVEHSFPDTYFPSLSSRTFVYKGMLATGQLRGFFPELADARLESATALVHARFSTNTFPSWRLAHPYRLVAHNGEINTIRGNRGRMQAREALARSELLGGGLERISPVVTPGGSDSASFDEVLELLHLAGRPLPHALLMMVPEAWEHHEELDADRRAFYEYHACLMEPWDGPAVVAFSDGTLVGAVLDRNGFRPARYWVTSGGLVILASEVGVLDVDPSEVVTRGRLKPGRMLLVDTERGEILDDARIKAELAAGRPYRRWLAEGLVHLGDLPPRRMLVPQHASILRHQRLFGYTAEELRVVLAPMATTGHEPVGSMGEDAPIAVLSQRPRLLYDYFTQLFAQVTNPPLDAIREELVTSLASTIGPEGNLLEPGAESCRRIVLPYPVIDNSELAKLLYIDEPGGAPGYSCFAVDGLFPAESGGAGLEAAIEKVCARVSEAIALGASLVVLSDRHANEELAPVPALLLTAAVHNHLVREKERSRVGLVVETGEAREVHHLAALLSYGAAAVNPYLAFDSVSKMVREGALDMTEHEAVRNYTRAAAFGVLKVMSKMGISTLASYIGAQVFEAVGLGPDFVGRYFTGTPSRLGGIGSEEVAEEVRLRHREAFRRSAEVAGLPALETGGEHQWRRDGEHHLFNPRTVFKLQHSTREKRFDIFGEYTSLVDEQSERLATLRGLLRFAEPGASGRAPVPVEEVEPAAEIVKRFATGAMSYGSISAEAHETLAVAMNRLGAKSNTGEGGEDPERFTPDANGDLRRSAVKQVASGRFGVTSEYLVNADDIQIKIAQGAKPGEGGQLPGHKVYPWIARTRHSTPGVGLISPPPHHDIYSIEDLAQLIYDLKNANPRARVHVKLVAEVGVGTVAAGVAKAHADVVLISGHDGGTGAAPLTSIKHAGVPWELGLAETQQTLLRNGLRDRIVVQVDGQLKTGRDVVVAALLGAEEFGFASAPLVVSGCVMMRVCHLDTCPVGIATQNPELRERFTGRPEFVETFFEFVAEEVRQLLASLGFRSLSEAVGHVECLDAAPALDHFWKAGRLDLRPLLLREAPAPELSAALGGDSSATLRCSRAQDHGLDQALDNRLIELCSPALRHGRAVSAELEVRNVHRSVGTMLGHEVTRRYGGGGLPDDTIALTLRGSAGQSFGAFLPRGVTLRLVGDANDYLGKGLSGGRVVVGPDPRSPSPAEEQVVAGNVVLYGATSGEAYLRGQAGERFCVRNSGATAVVEGVGDHACEYMTGGTVLVIGPFGRNFGAGMSGGVAYVHDPGGLLPRRCNHETVELEPLSEADAAEVTALLRSHLELTGSQVAARSLERLDAVVAESVKVLPRDLRRVLEAMEEARERGESPEEAMMAAARG